MRQQSAAGETKRRQAVRRGRTETSCCAAFPGGESPMTMNGGQSRRGRERIRDGIKFNTYLRVRASQVRRLSFVMPESMLVHEYLENDCDTSKFDVCRM